MERERRELDGGSRPRLARKARLRRDPVAGGWLLVFPEAALALNETAPAILELCDGTRTVDEIVALLARRFPQADPRTIEADTRRFLARLRARGLLEGS